MERRWKKKKERWRQHAQERRQRLERRQLLRERQLQLQRWQQRTTTVAWQLAQQQPSTMNSRRTALKRGRSEL